MSAGLEIAQPASGPTAARRFRAGRAWRAQVAAEVINRRRSPATLIAFLVILIGSYWAIPPADGRAVSMSWKLADGRLQAPLYTAGYLGIAVSVLALLFFLLAAFYLVAGSVRRDRERGIGEILAATPIGKTAYLGAKLAANALYLALLALLCLPVGLFHFLRSGVGRFDALQFFAPHLLLVVPAALFVAAAALLWDVTPVLRSRGGLVLWFLLGVLPILAVSVRDTPDGPAAGRTPAFDPFGMAMHEQIVRRSLPPGARGISSGYVVHDEPVERVAWRGLVLPTGLWRQRALNTLWALLPFFAAALIFDRFDPARLAWRRRRRSESASNSALHDAPTSSADGSRPPAAAGEILSVRSFARLAAVRPHPSAIRAVLAEARLLWESASRAKWLLAIAALAAALVPGAGAQLASAAFLLLVIPVVSEAACREDLAGTRALVMSQPAVPSSVVLWKFAAVGALLLVLGLPLALRGALTGTPAALAVPLGLLFVAAFAVGAASLTGGGKLFSGLFLLLWYLALNGLEPADFCALLAPSPSWNWWTRLAYLLVGAVWLAAAELRERRRLAGT